MSKKVLDVLEQIEIAIRQSSESLDGLNKKALEGGLGFNELVRIVDETTLSMERLTKTTGILGSAMTANLDMGLISGGMALLGDTLSTVLGGATRLAGILDSMGSSIDSVTGYSRNLNASLYESVSRFNGSFQAAKQFSDYIINSSQDFATAEMGFISPADRIAAVKGLEQAGIPLAHLSDTINSAAGSMDLLNTSFLHSKSLGLSVAKYTELIGHAMLTQGLSSQEAAEQMAMFGDTSQSTGIRTDKVAGSLQRLAGNFSKLGLTADFGQPILESFASSLKGMGLGFENAIDLSETLSGALVKLSSNYASAYVTFQRGGLDMGGGGGALGAGIGLRAKLLEANKEGGDQGSIAMEMAGALKDTLASFAGGQIVTVQEAAMDPSLQATFYTQTKLLEDLYGIQDPGAQDRTLELLDQLGKATTSGNVDLAESLGSDLQDIMQGRDETLGYQEKTSKFTEATFAELQFMNQNIINAFRISGDSLSGVMTDFQKSAIKTIEPQMKTFNDMKPEDMAIDFRSQLASLSNSVGSGLDGLNASIDSLDLGADFINGLQRAILTTRSPTTDEAIALLSTSINSLVSSLNNSNVRTAKLK